MPTPSRGDDRRRLGAGRSDAAPRVRPWLGIVGWALSGVALGFHVWGLALGIASTVRVVGIAAVAVVALLVVPRWFAVVLSVAGAVVAHVRFVPYVGAWTIALAVVLPSAWCYALGAVLPGARRHQRPVLEEAVWPMLLATVAVGAFDSVVAAFVLTAVAGLALAHAWVRALDAERRARGVLPATSPRPEAPRWRRVLGANQRLLDRVGRPIGVATGAVAMLPLGAVLSGLWIGQRITKYDALEAPTVGGTRWVRRSGDEVDRGRAYGRVAVLDPRGLRPMAQRWGGALLSVAIIAAAAGVPTLAGTMLQNDPPPTGDTSTIAAGEPSCRDFTDNADNPAMRLDPAWPEIACDNGEFIQRPHFDPATTFIYKEYRSRHLNERNAERRTWTPPECGCRRLTVWWFGGSAAWGAFQRDEHTIPSNLAKLAHEAGITLDVTNFAMPAWVLGQEYRRFQALLAERPAPDVVMFYDGGNELSRQRDRNAIGRGDDDSATTAVETELDSFLRFGPFGDLSATSTTTTLLDPADRESPEVVADAAMARYTRELGTATRIAESVGATPVFVWQPLAPAAPERVAVPDMFTPEERRSWERTIAAARAQMPPGVIDLSDSLDDAERPLFPDLWHTNELGATMVAEELLAQVRPLLELVRQRPADPAASPTTTGP